MFEIIPNWHPILVHFTITLFTISVMFYSLAILWRSARWQGQWIVFGHWNLWLGVVISTITIMAGWYAFHTVDHDTTSQSALISHRNWAMLTFYFFLGLAIWAAYLHYKKLLPSMLFGLFGIVGLVMLVATGKHGSELVYRYGLGVMSLPVLEIQDSNPLDHNSSH